MEAVLLIGVQGSGKSTFFKERFFQTHVRVSRDMLKTRRREQLLVEACLTAKQPFVVDDTNATRAQRAEFIAPARAAGFRVTGYFFRCKLEDALRRNRQRSGKQVIPAPGVIATFRRLEPPRLEEGFSEIREVAAEGGQFVVHPASRRR